MSRKAEIYIDGASKGNPGEASYGVVIKEKDRVIMLAGYLGKMTNNEAEYQGLLAALTWAVENRMEEVTIFSDSELIVRQIRGLYRVKHPDLKPLFTEAKLRIAALPGGFRIEHVPRERNRDSDRLVNMALDRAESSPEDDVVVVHEIFESPDGTD